MELRGCSETNHRRAQIQPRATERLRNAHLARGNRVPRRAASGGHGTLHPDDDTAPPIRGPRRAGHRAAGRRVRLPDPDPHPVRRGERLAVRGGIPRAVGLGRAERVALGVRRGRRGLRSRPGDHRVAGPRHERPEREPVRRDRGAGHPAPRHHGDQARRARRVRQARAVRLHHVELREGQPGRARQRHRGAVQGAGADAPGRVAARPVHRAAHEPGRGPVRRRDQEDVRRHEHGRDRPGREDHLRPRVHPRAPGPAVHAARRHRRREGPGRPRARPLDARRGRRDAAHVALGPAAHDAPGAGARPRPRSTPPPRRSSRACRRSSRTRSCSRTRAASR